MFLVCPIPLPQTQNLPLVPDPGLLVEGSCIIQTLFMLFTLFTGVGYQLELTRSVITDVKIDAVDVTSTLMSRDVKLYH